MGIPLLRPQHFARRRGATGACRRGQLGARERVFSQRESDRRIALALGLSWNGRARPCPRGSQSWALSEHADSRARRGSPAADAIHADVDRGGPDMPTLPSAHVTMMRYVVRSSVPLLELLPLVRFPPKP
jgi:hypothetical protein